MADDPVDIIHAHSLWHPVVHHAVKAGRRSSSRIALSPRGTLEPWSLKWRAWKKRIALSAYQAKDLKAVGVLFATSEMEAKAMRNFGLCQPIAVIPNGVDPHILESGNWHSRWRDGHGTAAGRRVLLFLGRIHPKKGLVQLLEAWADVKPFSWRLLIYGNDQEGHSAEVQEALNRLNLNDDVVLMGPVEDQARSHVYGRADAFVLPSFSENFGLTVVEALASGLPVITTRGTPWQSLVERQTGWWIHPNASAIAATLRELDKLSDRDLSDMSERALLHAREFGWPKIAERVADVYEWMLHRRDIPDCIVTD